MKRFFIISLIAAVLFFGCATDPGPKPTFKAGTRVGIFNSLDPYLTHRHITVRRFDSFERQIKVDWDMPAYVDRQIATALKSDTRFAAVPVESPQVQSELQKLADKIGAAASRRRVSKDLADFIDAQATIHDLDVIIMAQSFRGESPWKIHDDPVVLEGYGLFTRRTFLGTVGIRNSWVHPYAQTRVVVFKTRPAARIGAGVPRLTRSRMEGFNWPADIKNIPPDELEKLRPGIEAYMDQAVKNALGDAGMISFK